MKKIILYKIILLITFYNPIKTGDENNLYHELKKIQKTVLSALAGVHLPILLIAAGLLQTQQCKNFIKNTLITKIKKTYKDLPLTIQTNQASNVLNLSIKEGDTLSLPRIYKIMPVNWLYFAPKIYKEKISFTRPWSIFHPALENVFSMYNAIDLALAFFISEKIKKNDDKTKYVIIWSTLPRLAFFLGSVYLQYNSMLDAIENNLIRYDTCTIDCTNIFRQCLHPMASLLLFIAYASPCTHSYLRYIQRHYTDSLIDSILP